VAVPAALTILGVTPMALRAGAPRVQEGLASYVVALLGSEALAVLAVVLSDVRAAIAAATIGAVAVFAPLALFGGPQRGTVTFRAAALWMLVDAAALAALALWPSWHGPLLVIAVIGPGLVRLAAGPWSIWALPVLEQAPVSAACLVGGTVAPTGVVLLCRATGVDGLAAGVRELLPVLGAVLAAAVVGGAGLVVVERDLRRTVAHLLGVLGTLAATGLLAAPTLPAALATTKATTAAVSLVVTTGFAAAFALMIVEAIERRLETRRVHELAGLVAGAPSLGLLLPAALLALCGVPGFGSGVAAWTLCAALLADPAASVGLVGALGAAALLASSVVVVVVAGRAALPHRRKQAGVRVSFRQGLRLLLPLVALVVASVVAPAGIARALATAAPASAGAPDGRADGRPGAGNGGPR
jgi:NADH:ubiquinone oxidoreductase subunit 4 (subunit M)